MATRETKALPDVFIDFLKAVDDMKSTVMVPHVLVDLSAETLNNNNRKYSENGKELPAVPSGEASGLYGHYEMLLRLKDELTSGHKMDVSADNFRSQVGAVVESLNYFKTLAREVTQSYCQVCEERSLGTIRRVSSDTSLSASAVQRAGELRAYRERKFSAY